MAVIYYPDLGPWLNDAAFPVKKKLNVESFFSHEHEKLTGQVKKVKDVQDKVISPDEILIKPSFNLDAETILPKGDVSSVKIVNGIPIDFRCTVCKKLPIKLSRSELYKHYSRHFYIELMKEFGHLEICPFCKLELKNFKSTSIPSHFGQKHSFVENFLPSEAWIPLTSLGANIAKGKSMGTSHRTLNRRDGKILKKVEQVVNHICQVKRTFY